jgi:hypothetical protein
MGISTFPAASAGGVTARTLKQKVFNTSGTFTYPTSSNFDGTVEVTVVAGGGAGGGAFNRSGSTQQFLIGAGGGGQVISKKQLSILNAGNQTVTVGEGGAGYLFTGGLFGHISSFGSGYIRNLYPDPALTKSVLIHRETSGYQDYPESSSVDQSYENPSVLLWSSGSNPPQPPAGNTYVQMQLGNSQTAYSQYMSVKGSTSYRVIYSHTFYSGGSNVAVYAVVQWYNSSGIIITSDSLTGFTTQSASGTWSTVTSTLTSPSTAAYARINWTGGGTASFTLNGIQFAETAANVTTVAYGGASGYAWTGVPDNSYTVGENETLVAAQGGGGGWGICTRVSGNSTMHYLPGHPGYTMGGMSMGVNGSSAAGTGNIHISGCGAGAGGNAMGPEGSTMLGSGETYKIIEGSAKNGFLNGANGTEYTNWHAGINTAAAFNGGPSMNISMTANNIPYFNFGANGRGIDGYGYGGSGAGKTGVTYYNDNFKMSGASIPNALVSHGAQYTNSAAQQIAYRGRPNSGNGGSGWYAPFATNTSTYSGPRGGSGVVIVRWYE